MRSFLSLITGGDGAKNACLKIVTKNDFVFLRGAAEEAVEQTLSGVVSLRLPVGQHALGVRLRMVGFLRCRDHGEMVNDPASFGTILIFEHECPPLVIDHGRKVGADASGGVETHEWPFEIAIPGDTPETFKGCARCSVTYQLTASTIRDKTSASAPHAYRPVRINRTLQNSAFELMDAVSAEGTWADRMAYCVSVGHRAVALGTAIPLEVRLTPVNKETRVAQVRCELMESHNFVLEGGRPLPEFSGDRLVAEWSAPVDGLELDSAQPVYKISQKLPLPSEPKGCSPDMEIKGINTTHALHVVVDVVKPGDETFKSRHRAILPVVLFISPKIPINASEEFVRPKDFTVPEDSTNPYGGLDVPPVYGEHVDDKMLERSDESTPPDSPINS